MVITFFRRFTKGYDLFQSERCGEIDLDNHVSARRELPCDTILKTNFKSITFTRYRDYLPVSSGPLKVAKLGSPGELLSRRRRKLVRHDHIHVARYVAATVDPVEDFHFLDEDIGAIVDGYPGRILLQCGANSAVANILRVPIDARSSSSKVGIL